MRLLLVLCLGATLGVAGCSTAKEISPPAEVAAAAPVRVSSNIADRSHDVKVDTVVTATAEDGTITGASLYVGDDPKKHAIAGTVTGTDWVASSLLEPGQTYHFTVNAQNADGKSSTSTTTFQTQQLTLQQQTFPSVAPLQGETVGVGMPVIVKFDLPVHNRALFERKMRVESTPAVEGSWSWISDNEVHYRPKNYWPVGTKVRVRLDVNSLPAGAGVYGQKSQDVSFTIGRSMISTVDVATHKMTVRINGKVAKVIPVTTGNATHQSREGTKIVMEKLSTVDMDAASTGVDAKDPDYYNMKDVRWAMRLTNSGEFVHAAPWSVGSQGHANVSHGCTGLSTANAGWLFGQSRRGDVFRFVNSTRAMEPGNGYTDWNMSWSAYTNRSAL